MVKVLDINANTMVSGYKVVEGLTALINGRYDLYSECYREEHNTIPMEHFLDSLMKKIKRDVYRLENVRNHVELMATVPYKVLKLMPAYCDSRSKYTGIVTKKAMDQAVNIAKNHKIIPNVHYEQLPNEQSRALIHKISDYFNHNLGLNQPTVQVDNLGNRALIAMLRAYGVDPKQIVNNFKNSEDCLIYKNGKFTGKFNTFIGQLNHDTFGWLEFLLLVNIDLKSISKHDKHAQKIVKRNHVESGYLDKIKGAMNKCANGKMKLNSVIKVFNEYNKILQKLDSRFLFNSNLDRIRDYFIGLMDGYTTNSFRKGLDRHVMLKHGTKKCNHQLDLMK